MNRNANTLKIVLAQVSFPVGAILKNAEKMIHLAQQALESGADLIVFPELALTGYPPEDLLLRDDVLQQIQNALTLIQKAALPIALVFGYPEKTATALYNAACVISNGEIIARYHKYELPNYGVFDEKRYFKTELKPCVFHYKNTAIGLAICEDIWFPTVAEKTKHAGAEFLLCLNASPFDRDKYKQRIQVIEQRIKEQHFPILYVNAIGGQDELVFDGGSFAMNAECQLVARAPFFEEHLLNLMLQTKPSVTIAQQTLSPLPEIEAQIYQALVMGVRDYVNRHHFHGAFLGLSGGIDSALTLAIAVDALGADRVEVAIMPSRYTASMSVEDAIAQATRQGVKYHVISIEPVFSAFLESLQPAFEGRAADLTEENLQARCRGSLLMALSNKFGKIVLTTGNKSEMAVGYATLYGDMAGGFGVLKDVTKTYVYRLARYRNQPHEIIPTRVIERAPSAELAPNQVDQDSLPPYDILDAIIERFIEKDESIETIVAAGFALDTVKKVISLILKNEYKRRQAPLGPRVTPRAFGRDRRYPLSSGFKG